MGPDFNILGAENMISEGGPPAPLVEEEVTTTFTASGSSFDNGFEAVVTLDQGVTTIEGEGVPVEDTEDLLTEPEPYTPYHKYPDIDNLVRNPAVLEHSPLVIQEKLDGANSRFGLTPGREFWAGSRNQKLDLTDDRAGYGFVGWLKSAGVEDIMRKNNYWGMTFYGEWVGPKVNGRVRYPEGAGFYVFGVRSVTGRFESVKRIASFAKILGLAMVPGVRVEHPIDEAFLIAHRDSTPLFGTAREGLVIKTDPPITDYRGNLIMAKLKSPGFEEVSRKLRPPKDPEADAAAQAFVDTFINLERVRHTFAMLREQGIDPTDIRSTGDVLRGVYDDITTEGAPEFAELGKEQQRRVGKLSYRTAKPLVEQVIALERQEVAASG